MQTELNDIEAVESTPILRSKKCKLLATILGYVLQYGAVVVTISSWVFYDFFTAFFTLAFTFIAMGVVSSKLQNSSIPPKQREHHYSDQEIATWYLSRHICFEYMNK
ncbi:MAG: hypothetical protein GQ570_14430 [Helicobacteraceae bacterium]|nr:hypothetical protein [Helicobacteraceae bacterium]